MRCPLHDAIQTPHHGTTGDLKYLRIRYLAASTMQTDVEAALVALLDQAEAITADRIKELVGRAGTPTIPDLVAPVVDLLAYDQLLTEVAA